MQVKKKSKWTTDALSLVIGPVLTGSDAIDSSKAQQDISSVQISGCRLLTAAELASQSATDRINDIKAQAAGSSASASSQTSSIAAPPATSSTAISVAAVSSSSDEDGKSTDVLTLQDVRTSIRSATPTVLSQIDPNNPNKCGALLLEIHTVARADSQYDRILNVLLVTSFVSSLRRDWVMLIILSSTITVYTGDASRTDGCSAALLLVALVLACIGMPC